MVVVPIDLQKYEKKIARVCFCRTNTRYITVLNTYTCYGFY